MDLVMNLLLTVVLAQTVSCEESRCVSEKRERGRNPRHITAYVKALEGLEGDLDVSDDYHDTHDEEADKEQVSLHIFIAPGHLSEWTFTAKFSIGQENVSV